MENKAKIKEIFSSIQGEGLYIGTKQLFIRFCACNLRCKYCDTPFLPVNINEKDTFFDFTPDELIQYVDSNFDLTHTNSVSLTGGEPLIWNEFLKEFLPKFNHKIYLETNATISEGLDELLPYIEIIAADIKLPSCSGVNNSFELHERFFNTIFENSKKFNQGNIFAKVIFDSLINDFEIEKTVRIAKKYALELILQPKMIGDTLSVNNEFIINIFEKFSHKYNNVRLIPQVHKFLDIE